MKLTVTVKTLWGISVLLLLLGIGNILFGYFRSEYYSGVLEEARAALRQERVQAEASVRRNSPAEQTIGSDGSQGEPQSEYIRRITGRLSYYRFSILGGKLFLLGAVVCALIGVLLTAQGEGDNKAPAEEDP